MLGTFLMEPCITLGILGPRNSLTELRDCYSSDNQTPHYDEGTLVKMRSLMKKAKHEFRNCCNDIVNGWNVQNWDTGRIAERE